MYYRTIGYANYGIGFAFGFDSNLYTFVNTTAIRWDPIDTYSWLSHCRRIDLQIWITIYNVYSWLSQCNSIYMWLYPINGIGYTELHTRSTRLRYSWIAVLNCISILYIVELQYTVYWIQELPDPTYVYTVLMVLRYVYILYTDWIAIQYIVYTVYWTNTVY